MGMGLQQEQQVCDLLHKIADLVQEADSFLNESSLSPTPFNKASRKKGRPSISPTSFAKSGDKRKQRGLFTSLVQTKPRKSGLEPHKVDRITNRLRNMGDRIDKKDRDVNRAKRERKQRSRYQAKKLLTVTPQKSLGTKFRAR